MIKDAEQDLLSSRFFGSGTVSVGSSPLPMGCDGIVTEVCYLLRHVQDVTPQPRFLGKNGLLAEALPSPPHSHLPLTMWV